MTISRDNVVTMWLEWYQQNAQRFRYSPIRVGEKAERGVYTIALNGITPRIRFVLYASGRGGDVYILDRSGEFWDFLLWLDAPGEETRYDAVHDTFEPFLRWTNALEQVEQIYLVSTPDGGCKATRFVSAPDAEGNRDTLVYNDKIQSFTRIPESHSESALQLCDAVFVHG
jgi:hypothetical protein